VTIETPTLADLPELLKESKPMFEEMGFEEYGNAWDFESMIEWWKTVLTTNHHSIVIARESGRIIGVSVVCYTDRFFWHKGPIHANELAHHAAPDLPTFKRCKIMIKMLAAMIEKMREKGAVRFFIGYDPKPQFAAWGDYLKRKGFIDTSHVLMAKVGGL
jgi:hypothetical protein